MEVRQLQEGLQYGGCLQWQHRKCYTGKFYLFICLLIIIYLLLLFIIIIIITIIIIYYYYAM